MPKDTKVHLHGIDGAFKDVEDKLKAIKKEVDPYYKAKIEAKLKKLRDLRGQLSRVCPELFFVWPTAEMKVAARKKKTKAKAKK